MILLVGEPQKRYLLLDILFETKAGSAKGLFWIDGDTPNNLCRQFIHLPTHQMLERLSSVSCKLDHFSLQEIPT